MYKDVSVENRFQTFLHSINPTDRRQIQPSELDVILSKFFMTANRIDKHSIYLAFAKDMKSIHSLLLIRNRSAH